jgi:hypothetical protein
MSNGALIGGTSPEAQLILNQGTNTWELLVHLNKAFATQTEDKKYVYHLLVPKQVGCGFVLYDALTNSRTDFNHYEIDGTGIVKDTGSTYETVSATEVHAHLDFKAGTEDEVSIGCFNQYILTVYVSDGFDACNMSVCITGTLFVNCGQKTEGCDKFPVRILLAEDAVSAVGDSLTTGLDTGNDTTLLN